MSVRGRPRFEPRSTGVCSVTNVCSFVVSQNGDSSLHERTTAEVVEECRIITALQCGQLSWLDTAGLLSSMKERSRREIVAMTL